MITQNLETTPTPELNKALYITQQALIQPTKNKEAHYGKYADLSAIDAAIRKAIKVSDSGISFSQGVVDDSNANGKVSHKVYTVIRHSSGEEKILYGDSFPDDPNMQKQGANETYAKRTSLCLAFGIVADDDDDGQSASLLDAYKDKQDEIRTKTNNWLAAELAQINKKDVDQLRLVLKSKDKKVSNLTYMESLTLAGAVRYFKMQNGQIDQL